MNGELEAEMEALLKKYAGGRMPPLVDMDNPKSGLINGELLQTYHKGLLSRHSIRLGILLPAKRYHSLEEKWQRGDFRLNELSRPNWTSFCKTLRKTKTGDKDCDACDRRRAIIAEKAGQAIAYLCDNGLISFAMPVSVMGRVIAVLFSGQYKPQEGPIWNPEFIQRDGCFRPLAPGETGVDAWAESQRRIQQIEQKAGFPQGTLLESLFDNERPVREVSPQDVEEIIKLMKVAGEQLSGLASSTYELEKNKLVGWIQGHIASSLMPLSTAPLEDVEAKEVWERLSLALSYMTRYFRLDYALILSCCEEPEKGIRILCQYGIPKACLPRGEDQRIDKGSHSRLISVMCEQEKPFPLTLQEFKDLPIFDCLYRLHVRRKSKRALAIPILLPIEDTPLVMILGKLDRDIDFGGCLPEDKRALQDITADIRMVTGLILLIERLRETARKQALFSEDMAHDIRNPIQNIVVMADTLARGFASAEEIPRLARRLAAQARRLHLISNRVWILRVIDQGEFKPEQVEHVNVYHTLMECRKSLLELAERRGIKISVDRELAQWPPVQVNKTLFIQAALNLIDNAIKYSRKGTEVRIDGKRLADGVTLSFVNRGIPIRDEDKERIFKRYYRAKEARAWVQEGTGIGLSIVKAFAEYYGGIEVKSTPIHGSQDYVTEFKLFIRKRGWQRAQSTYVGRRRRPQYIPS